MTWARAAALGVALVVVVCPSPAVTQSATPLWLAPSGKPTGTTAAFAAAVQQLADGKATAALPVFARNVSDSVLGGYALLAQGRAQLAAKKPAEAKFTAQQLIKVEPRDYLREAAFVLLAEANEASGDWAAAVRALEGALDTHPVNGAALTLRLGRDAKQAALRTRAREAFAAVVYDFALSAEAADAQAELATLTDVPADRDLAARDLARAEQLYAAKRYADARKIYDNLKPQNSDDHELAELRVAECDLGLKRYKDARAAIEAIASGTSERRVEAGYARLGVLRGLEFKREFVADTRRFVAAHAATPWAAAALNDLATFYILEDDDASAAQVFAEIYARYPNGAFAERAAWKSGWWAYLKGNHAETVRVFDDAFARFTRSDYRSAWSYWSARARQQMGQREAAADGFRRVIDLYKNSYYGREAARVMTTLAPTRASKGTVSKVALETGLAFDPGEPPPNARLITKLLEVGLWDDAIGEIKRAEREFGAQPILLASEAYAWNRKGELRIAINTMKRAYPQFMASGGETLPVEIRRVIFPMAYWDLIQKYADGRDLDPYLMAALITQESTFQADVKSAANAWGVMQVVPSTGRSYAAKLGVTPWRVSKLTNPDVNIRIGMAYFSDLVKTYDGVVGALVAYNAGGSRYRKWVQEYPGADRDEFIDNIPFFETQNYVKRILGTADDFRALYPRTRPARGH